MPAFTRPDLFFAVTVAPGFTATAPAGRIRARYRLGVAALTVLSLALAMGPAGDRTPDRCWKWGLFYYNPDDPAIMVEKRFGIGYTFNFARRTSWIILGAIFAMVLVPWFLVR